MSLATCHNDAFYMKFQERATHITYLRHIVIASFTTFGLIKCKLWLILNFVLTPRSFSLFFSVVCIQLPKAALLSVSCYLTLFSFDPLSVNRPVKFNSALRCNNSSNVELQSVRYFTLIYVGFSPKVDSKLSKFELFFFLEN